MDYPPLVAEGRFVDLRTWKRREHYLLYRALPQPFWGLTVDVDVTGLWDACARDGRSFFLASSYAALAALNEIEAFRLRLRPEGVWRHDTIGISPTIMRPDETFGFSRMEYRASFAQFEADAQRVIDRVRQETTLIVDVDDDVVYSSVLPWTRFTSFTNPIGGPDDSVPRLVFGRAALEGAIRRMPVGVEVHHALVDGLDVARFVEGFEHRLAQPLW